MFYSLYFYFQNNITLSSLLIQLKEKQLFEGCRMSRCSLIRKIGFKFKKDDPKRGLMKLTHVALKRFEFLKSYIKQKEEAVYKFVFLDEIWIFQNGTIGRPWQDDNKRSVKTTKVDSKRYATLN